MVIRNTSGSWWFESIGARGVVPDQDCHGIPSPVPLPGGSPGRENRYRPETATTGFTEALGLQPKDLFSNGQEPRNYVAGYRFESGRVHSAGPSRLIAGSSGRSGFESQPCTDRAAGHRP